MKLKDLVYGREVTDQGIAQAVVSQGHAITGLHKLCPQGVNSRELDSKRLPSLAFCVLSFRNLARDAGSPIKQPFQ